MLCEQKAKLISSRVGADAAVKDKRKKDIIAANFKGALDAEIMIAKETGDLQTHGCALESTQLPRLMGLLNNPGGGGTLYGVSEPQHTDSMF